MREGPAFYVEENFAIKSTRFTAVYLNAREPSLHELFDREKNNVKQASVCCRCPADERRDWIGRTRRRIL